LTAAHPMTGDNGRRSSRRLAWRGWRRTRPFWGGLLILLAGAEIISTTLVSLGPTFRVGLGGVNGFFGTVIALLLALCGLLLWFSPAQRLFYSIVAVVLALATFNTINYGGFFIGMLLGLTGGGLAFAWSPAAKAKAKAREDTERTEPERTEPHGHGRLLSVVAILAAAVLLAPSVHGQRAAAAERAVAAPQAGSGCILFILCTPSSPKPTPTPTPTGTSAPSPGQPGSGSSQGSSSSPGGKNKGKVKHIAAPHGLVASSVPAVLDAGSAKLVGLAYDGVAQVPMASGGSQPMMKFSLQSVTLTGRPTLTIHQDGSVATTSTSLLSFTGHVVLYATKLSGDLLGIPVTLTTSSPLSLVLQLLRPLTSGLTVTMTNVVTNQPTTTSDASTWSDFLISVKPGS
jgi:uncharacterized protein DUF6114